MSTVIHKGDAVALAQVTTLTVAGNWLQNETITLTINGKDLVLTVGTLTTTAQIATSLKQAWEGETLTDTSAATSPTITQGGGTAIPEHSEITASVSSSVVTLTADAPGVPFTVTASDNSTGTNEVQTITITGTPTGGDFTLTYDGQTTGNIAYNADAATVQAALEALSNIGAGDVSCGGGALPGSAVTVTFQGALAATNVAQMTADDSGLTGGSTPEVTVATITAGLAAGSVSVSTTTANTGPKVYENTDNWNGGALPADGDDVIIEKSDRDILYGTLDQSDVEPTSLRIRQSYTGKIGLPVLYVSASNSSVVYYEYRPTYWTIGAALIVVGEGEGAGSGRLKLDSGTDQTELQVFNTGTPEFSDTPALLWKGTHASNVARIWKGFVGIAFFGGETATVATLHVGHRGNVQGDAKVICGAGCTLTTIVKTGGDLTINSAATTITHKDGVMRANGTGAITTLTVDGGTVFHCSSGTITNLNIGDGGVVDFSQDTRAVTVTNCTLQKGAKLLDPQGRVTFTNGIVLDRCKISDVTLDVGDNRTLTPS